MNHRQITLQFLRTSGLIPMALPPKSKAAYPNWDPRKAKLQRDHSHVLHQLLNSPDENIGALFAGKFIDIDDDTDPKSGVSAALDHFLPQTPFVWGRAHKRRAHRVFVLNNDLDRSVWGGLFTRIKKLKLGGISYSVEFRGGKHESGMYAVLPGSIHPEGDEYMWADSIDPTISMPMSNDFDLIRRVRFAIVAAIMSNYWVEGQRNDLCMAFSGLMWRIRAATLAMSGKGSDEDVDDRVGHEMLVLSKEDAKSILQAIMLLGGDDEADRRARMGTFDNSWRKLETDPSAKVTGGKALAEMIGEEGGDVVKALYWLLCDSDGVEQFEELSERFVLWYGPGVLVDLDLIAKGVPTPWMTKDQARNSLGDKRIRIGGDRIDLAPLLFKMPIIQRIYGMTFDPSKNQMLVENELGLQVNQWHGFNVVPCEANVKDKDVKPFLDYVLEVLADGNEEMAKWILAWIADMFQEPGKKPGTALVLVGVQGAGKTFVGEHIIRPLVGARHSVAIHSASTLTDKFNTIIDNKIFVQCDEAIHQHEKVTAQTLKKVITDDTIQIEPKNVNAYHKPNHMRVLFTSNNEDRAIFIDASDNERRFTVAKVSTKRAKDLEYWTFMHQWTKANLPKLMKWLLTYQYEKRLIMRPVDNEAKRNIQKVGLDPELAWIVSRVASGHILGEHGQQHWWQAYHSDHITDKDKDQGNLRREVWPNVISMQAIEEDFKRFIRAHGRTVYSGSVATSIKRVLPPGSVRFVEQPAVTYIDQRSLQKVKVRPRLYSLPTQDEIRKHLRVTYGQMVDEMIEQHEDFASKPEEPAKKKGKERF